MLPLDNEFVENIGNEVGEDGIFNGDYVKQVEDTTESVFLEMRSACRVSDSTNFRGCYLDKTSITKATLVKWLETTVFLLNSCPVPLLDFALEQRNRVEELKSERIADQRKIIDLLEKLIVENDANLQLVQKTVKTEMQLYSSHQLCGNVAVKRWHRER